MARETVDCSQTPENCPEEHIRQIQKNLAGIFSNKGKLINTKGQPVNPAEIRVLKVIADQEFCPSYPVYLAKPDGYHVAISDKTWPYGLAVNTSTGEGETGSIKLLLPSRINTLGQSPIGIAWQSVYNASLEKCYVDQYLQPDLKGGCFISEMTIINSQGKEATLDTQDSVIPEYAVLFVGFDNINNYDPVSGYFHIAG